MNRKNRTKTVSDAVILLCSVVLCLAVNSCPWLPVQRGTALVICGLLAAAAAVDLAYQMKKQATAGEGQKAEEKTGIQSQGIDRLILLDEENRPIKSWDMVGRVAVIIGREGRGEEVDVDLKDCAFSAFIDFQHAVLNFCLDQWYVEDVSSQNGIKIQKAEDGECYKVMGRPCRVQAGDILYIAKTRLLLS
jgi:FHA domain.